LTKAVRWFPEDSGAMQPRSRAKKGGEIVFCAFCQCGIYVTDFGYGLVTQVECPNCFRVLQKNQLVLDLLKWRTYNGLEVNHVGNIKVDETLMETGTQAWYKK